MFRNKNIQNVVKSTSIMSATEEKTVKGKLFKFCCLIALIVFAALAFFPLLWALLSGFKSQSEFYYIPPTFFPAEWNCQNFTDLFTVYKIQDYLLNSIVVIGGTLVVEITFAATAGYVLSKIKCTGWKILLTMILWTMMMPTTLSIVPLFLAFIDLPVFHINLMNSYVPFWLMAGANCFHIMMFKDFFDGIPTSYIEAATIDGAGKLQIFYRIVLPLSKPIIATLATFVIMGGWNDFFWPMLLLKDKEMYTVALAAYNFKAEMTEPQILMFSFVLLIPMIIVYFISQKFVVDNTNSEGDKG